MDVTPPYNGPLIKELIKEKGFTQASFSEALSISERTLRKMLHNGVFDLRTLYKMAKVLDVDVHLLVPDPE